MIMTQEILFIKKNQKKLDKFNHLDNKINKITRNNII